MKYFLGEIMKFGYGYQGIKPDNQHNDTEEIAEKYTKINDCGTGLLAYRDIPELINKYVTGNKALDFGCGTGYSTRLLKQLNFDVIGVDISMNMLLHALANKDGIPYAHITIGNINFPSSTFDLVLSCFVHMDMPSLSIMRDSQLEIARVLKQDGICIIVTTSENLPKENWESVRSINNSNLEVEKVYQTYIPHIDVTFNDYFYRNEDFIKIFSETGFEVLTTHFPIADFNESGFELEKKLSPITIYVLKKLSK